MPRPVEKVPDPWEPYKDGQIWEFTEEEIRKLPGFTPTTNSGGQMVGRRMMRWYSEGRHYVRFFDERDVAEGCPDDWPERLAGWTI